MEHTPLNGLAEVSQTLFIPLAVRTNEAQAAQPLFADPLAAELLHRCDPQGLVINGGPVASHGILARTCVLDEELARLLAQCPNTLVLNLGAGLDTRFFRLDNGAVRWYDLDLPPVTALRRQLLPESERLRFVAGSVLEEAWLGQLQRQGQPQVVILAEGLLMYFTEAQVTQLLARLAGAFPGAHMLFDVVHPHFVGQKISSAFCWGLNKATDIEALSPHAALVRAFATGSLLKQRQPPLLRALSLLPATNRRSQILHIILKE